MSACLDDNEAAALIDGGLDEPARRRAAAHLEECEACGALVSDAAAASGPPRLVRGQTLGRYVVLDALGSGAMGAVYAAFDPQLDRKVALKVLRPDADEASRAELQARLLREARAAARLAHPNVVAVHDVGTVDGEVFIAMEFIAGETLTSWSRSRRRGFREVLRALGEAGAGLAAAHREGIVHRDFKPDNVLVGHDGRVRVSDFGLARGRADDFRRADTLESDHGCVEGGSGAAGILSSRQAADAQAITRTGALTGTPAYMAPEQAEGLPATAQSDVYAFSVTLYEALYGERPFSGRTPRELWAASREGRIAPPKESRAVPSRLRAIVLRGLRADPGERWQGMPPMLQALARVEGRTRWPALAAAVAAALALSGLAWARSRAPLCTGAEQAFGDTWQGARRSAVQAALIRGLGDRGQGLFAQVDSTLERYRSAWMAAHTEACRATRLRGEQSEATLDLRMQCLEERRREASGLIRQLETADAVAADQSLAAAQRLADVGFCSNIAALAARARPPLDPARREAQAALQRSLDEASAAVLLRPPAESESRVEALVGVAHALGHRPDEARALLLRAGIAIKTFSIPRARAAGEEAAAAALESSDDQRAADSFILLTYADALHGGIEESDRDARLAEAALARLGGDAERLSALELARCRARLVYGDDFERARGFCERSRELLLAARGPDDLLLASIDDALGAVAFIEARFADAAALYRRALDLRTRLLGPGHTQRDVSRSNIAETLVELGRVDEALPEIREVVRHRPENAMLRTTLAWALRHKDDFAAARVEDEAALALCRRNRDTAYEATVLVGLADDLLGLRRPREALDAARRALESGQPLTPLWKARASLALARGIALARPIDLPRARAAVRQGSEAIRKQAGLYGGPYRDLLRELERWSQRFGT